MSSLSRFFLLLNVILFWGCRSSMSGDIEKILENKDHFELCNQMFGALLKYYGNELDVSKCKEKHQVVLLVWHASGIIDNGGFQYLFEGSFKGDPYFARTALAFKTIQAKKCAQAFKEALNLFPDSKPPQDIKKRLVFYQAHGPDERGAIDDKFFSESKEIRNFLARYIRENREAFIKLE